MKKKFYWKSVFNFLWVLLLILGIFYVNTALKDQQNGSKSKKVTTIEKKQNDNNIKLTTPRVKALKTSKMAAYIGVSSSVILTDFGQPTATVASASNLKWWLYNLNNQSYLKIGIDQYTKKVAAIFVVGPSKAQGKLKVGLSFKRLLQLTTLYANFKFNYREQAFQYELSENDLNRHPLISFKNGSYAIAYLKPKTKQIYALEYLNTDTLLKKNLYHLVAPVPLPAQYQGEVDWQQLEQMLPADFLQLVNAKRRQQSRAVIPVDPNLNAQTHAAADKLFKSPRNWLQSAQAKQLKSILNDDFSQKKTIFLHRSKLSKKRLKLLGLENYSKVKLWVIAPIYSSSTIFDQPKLLSSWINSFVETGRYRIGMYYEHGVLVIISSKGGI